MGAFKTGAIIGFGVGYMQGAKAGRQRYEQLQLKIKKVAQSPTVKKAIEPMKPVVTAKLESGKELMGTVMSKAAGVKPGASAATTQTARAGTAASNTSAGHSNPGV